MSRFRRWWPTSAANTTMSGVGSWPTSTTNAVRLDSAPAAPPEGPPERVDLYWECRDCGVRHGPTAVYDAAWTGGARVHTILMQCEDCTEAAAALRALAPEELKHPLTWAGTSATTMAFQGLNIQYVQPGQILGVNSQYFGGTSISTAPSPTRCPMCGK